MTALRHLPPVPTGPRPGVFRPRCLTAIGRAIGQLEALEAGPAVEAEILRALGWQAEAPRTPRAAWRCRSPLALAWMPLPPVTRVTDGAAILVPPGYDHGAGMRGGHGFAWVRRSEGDFFECRSGPPPILLCRAALHAWRKTLLETLP